MKLATFAPWALLAIVLAYPLFAQGTLTKVSRFNGPVKVFGIPHPDEWIDIGSNVVGQPAETYTVPNKHRLTLRAVFIDSNDPDSDDTGISMYGRLLIDGVPLGGGFEIAEHADIPPLAINDHPSSRLLDHWNNPAHLTGQTNPTFAPGTVLKAGQVLAVERYDPGDATYDGFADEDRVFVVRGFLEKVN